MSGHVLVIGRQHPVPDNLQLFQLALAMNASLGLSVMCLLIWTKCWQVPQIASTGQGLTKLDHLRRVAEMVIRQSFIVVYEHE